MTTERVFSLVMMGMTSDKMMLEDDLERIINNKEMSIEEKVKQIKTTMYNVSTIENAINKFSILINNNNNNNNQKED